MTKENKRKMNAILSALYDTTDAYCFYESNVETRIMVLNHIKSTLNEFVVSEHIYDFYVVYDACANEKQEDKMIFELNISFSEDDYYHSTTFEYNIIQEETTEDYEG